MSGKRPPGAGALHLIKARPRMLGVTALLVVILLVWLTRTISLQPAPESGIGWVSSLGVSLSLGGLLVSIVGFSFTLLQLSETVGSIDAAVEESERIRDSLVAQDAAQEASRASYALSSARKHFKNGAWADGAESYEDFRRSLTSLSGSVSEINDGIKGRISKASDYISKLCVRIERSTFAGVAASGSNASSASMPDYSKLISVMRDHGQLIDEINSLIQGRVFHVDKK